MSDAPRRTCIGCREVRDKGRLVRLVCLADGVVVVDRTGRMPGRGAYVCEEPRCLTRLGKGGRLTQAFRRACRPEAGLLAAIEAASLSTAGEAGSRGAVRMTNSINLMSAR